MKTTPVSMRSFVVLIRVVRNVCAKFVIRWARFDGLCPTK